MNITAAPELTVQPQLQVRALHTEIEGARSRGGGANSDDHSSRGARIPGYLVLLHCKSATGIKEHTHTRTLYHKKQCLRYEIRGLDEGGRVV